MLPADLDDGGPSGGGAILRLDFHPPEERVPGFEIIDLATLHHRRQRRGRRPDLVHRVNFHTLTLITEGTGEHAIDLVICPCRPGTLLWDRPGQVQRFVRPGTANGTAARDTAHYLCGRSHYRARAYPLARGGTGCGHRAARGRRREPGQLPRTDRGGPGLSRPGHLRRHVHHGRSRPSQLPAGGRRHRSLGRRPACIGCGIFVWAW